MQRKRRKLKPSIMNSYLKTFELEDEDEEEEETASSKPCTALKKKRKSPTSKSLFGMTLRFRPFLVPILLYNYQISSDWATYTAIKIFDTFTSF